MATKRLKKHTIGDVSGDKNDGGGEGIWKDRPQINVNLSALNPSALLAFNFHGLEEVFANGDDFDVLPGIQSVECIQGFFFEHPSLGNKSKRSRGVWEGRGTVELAANQH